MNNLPYIHSLFIGQPKTITDERGTYRSSILRTRTESPVELQVEGLAGDKPASRVHQGLESAVCCHLLDHYRFWNAHYGMDLQPGDVGENWALEGILEEDICVGDSYRVGSALVQVSVHRVPCETQARKIGRPDWVKLTLKELRTGFYMRVLEPGVVCAGDALNLVERPNPGCSIHALTSCYYDEFDPDVARQFASMPELPSKWQERFAKKLEQFLAA